MSNSIPRGWRVSTLGESAINVNKKYRALAGKNPRYVGLEHISPESRMIRNWGYAEDITSTKTVFQRGDTLFGKLRPNLKKISYANFSGICSTDILALRANDGVAPEFLYRILSSETVVSAAVESSFGNVMPRTSWAHLSDVDCLHPPLPEQQKIAAILSSVDDVIEKTRAQVDKLKDLKTGMMQELLTKGIGSGGVPHTEFKDSPVGRIPSDWQTVNVGSLAEVIDPQPDHRTPPEVKNGVPYVGLGDIGKSGFIDFLNARKVSVEAFNRQKSSFNIHPGAFIFGKIGTIGKPYVLPRDRFYCLSANVVLVTTSKTEMMKYLYQVFSSGIIDQQVLMQTNTTSQPALGIKKVRDFLVPIPNNNNELLGITEALNSIDDNISKTLEKLASQVNIKKALMQDLLTGKVRVKVDQKESAVA